MYAAVAYLCELLTRVITFQVCVEAVTVECSAGLKFSQAATLQSWQWGSGMVSGILGSVIGGYCLDSTGAYAQLCT